MKILILLMMFMNVARAADGKEFRPDRWSEGLHLNSGAGMNLLHSHSDDRHTELGYGLNFKTDLGYFFSHNFAAEWSSNVKFSKIAEHQTWDSLFTLGIRYRIDEYFVRAFAGRAPTVIFFNNKTPEEYKATKAEKLQYDGPVYGLSFGKTYKNDAGLVWFLETSATLQFLKKREAIYMNGDVPVVVEKVMDESLLTTFYFMIGFMVF